jgi:nucleoside transporter
MFLQFFVWGAWYVSMTGFMGKKGMGDLIAAAYSVGPLAAIISPFFLGMIADRFFPTQRVFAFMHLLGAVAIFMAPRVAAPFTMPAGEGFVGGLIESVKQPYVLMLFLHMLCFMPTLGLSSSLAFHNLTNREKQFPLVRVWGTIGWIAGNIAVSQLPGKDQSAHQFTLTACAGVALAVFALFLPHTPPPSKGKAITAREILGLDSLKLLAQPSYFVFILCSFLLCIPLAGYYAFARNYAEATGSVVNKSATFTMSFGQMSEIFFMLVMPLCFRKLGVKWMLAVGMLAWVVRYGLFAGAWDGKVMWMMLGGILLHGICYDFFFVTGMIYVDKAAGKDIRSQAQGFLVLITQGLGMLIGAQAFGKLVAHFTTKASDGTTTLAWKQIWMYPALFALAVLVLFVLLFREKREPART